MAKKKIDARQASYQAFHYGQEAAAVAACQAKADVKAASKAAASQARRDQGRVPDQARWLPDYHGH